MSYTGTVIGGVVKLPPEVKWPDGTAVRVAKTETTGAGNDLTRRRIEITATVKELPSDFAAQHDHYIHGTPKR